MVRPIKPWPRQEGTVTYRTKAITPESLDERLTKVERRVTELCDDEPDGEEEFGAELTEVQQQIAGGAALGGLFFATAFAVGLLAALGHERQDMAIATGSMAGVCLVVAACGTLIMWSRG
jgi:hypothetical protein